MNHRGLSSPSGMKQSAKVTYLQSLAAGRPKCVNCFTLSPKAEIGYSHCRLSNVLKTKYLSTAHPMSRLASRFPRARQKLQPGSGVAIKTAR
jgi:hypothetical protein